MPFWLKCITLFSLVSHDDPYNDSAFASPWRCFPCRLNRSGFVFISTLSCKLHTLPLPGTRVTVGTPQTERGWVDPQSLIQLFLSHPFVITRNQIVITGLRCHFGSCVIQPAFACCRSRPLRIFTFRFSICPFP